MSNEEKSTQPILTSEEISWLRQKVAESKGIGPAGEVVCLIKISGGAFVSKFPSLKYVQSLKQAGDILDYQLLE